MYPLPHCCKKVSWALLIIWAIAVNIMALLYGLQFDLAYNEEPNPDNDNLELFEEPCWENNKQLAIEGAIGQDNFNAMNDEIDEANDFSDNYGGIESESLRWLLACLQSFIMSIFLWQPITIYFMTWVKLWLFTWNLGFKTGPGNMLGLIKNCCCVDSSENEILMRKIRKDPNYDVNRKVTNKDWIQVYAERPLDLIGYFGNDALFSDTTNPNQHDTYNEDEGPKQIELVTMPKMMVQLIRN